MDGSEEGEEREEVVGGGRPAGEREEKGRVKVGVFKKEGGWNGRWEPGVNAGAWMESVRREEEESGVGVVEFALSMGRRMNCDVSQAYGFQSCGWQRKAKMEWR